MDDLISREAAMDKLDVTMRITAPDDYRRHLPEAIEQLSAVEAAPVVHGRWIETTIPANTTGHGGVGQDKKKGWICSNCKSAFDAMLLWCDSFCPNCGAKMDGERRDSE